MTVIDKIPFASQLRHITDLDERNAVFNTLSDEDKRKEIAYDALLLVLEKIARPSDGCYWGDSLVNLANNLNTSKELQRALVHDIPECYVCQRGLMMISQIRLGNSIKPGDRCKSHGSNKNLKGFSIDSFTQMECEYEFSFYSHPYIRNSRMKLMNICCNVLANGNFNENDKTNYLERWEIE